MSTNATSDVGGIAKRTILSIGIVIAAVILGNLGYLALQRSLEAVAGGIGAGPDLFVSLIGLQIAFAAVALLALSKVVGWESVFVGRPDGNARLVVAVGAGLAASVELLRQLAVRFTALEAASTLPTEGEIGAGAMLAVVAATVLVAPLGEELLFRGVVQDYVAGASASAVGIAVATLLFVPLHSLGILTTAPNVAAALAAFAPVTVLSVAAGVAYVRTENLTVPILLHVTYNLLTVVIAVAVVDASTLQ